MQFAPEPPPTVGWTHEKQVSGTIYVLLSTTLTKKNGPLSDLVFEMIHFATCFFLFFFYFLCAYVRFTAHKFRFSTRRNKPSNGKRVDHQQQIINSKGVVFGYRLLLLRSVKCKFGHRQGSYIKRSVALNYTRTYIQTAVCFIDILYLLLHVFILFRNFFSFFRCENIVKYKIKNFHPALINWSRRDGKKFTWVATPLSCTDVWVCTTMCIIL